MNIQLQNVTYTYAGKYQRVTAVDGVSYTFHDGTLYTIMGASGSGKSTLLSLLAGLKLPTEGEITLDEQPIRLMDRSALRRDTVSVIYQDFNLFPLLTAEGKLRWTPNPAYHTSQLTIKPPRDYSDLGLEKGKSIYRQFEENPDRFLFVSDPARAANIWKNYIP